MFQVTDRVRTIEYAIRDVLAQAKQLERKGKKIIYLNIGDPVKFDFDTPNHIKQALIKAVKEGANWYAPSEGLPELKEAICEKEKKVNRVEIQPEDVVVTHGISEGIQDGYGCYSGKRRRNLGARSYISTLHCLHQVFRRQTSCI